MNQNEKQLSGAIDFFQCFLRNRKISLYYDNHNSKKYCSMDNSSHVSEYIFSKINQDKNVHLLLEEIPGWTPSVKQYLNKNFKNSLHLKKYFNLLEDNINHPQLWFIDIRIFLTTSQMRKKALDILKPSNFTNGFILKEMHQELYEKGSSSKESINNIFEFMILCSLILPDKINNNEINHSIFYGGAEHCRKVEKMLKKLNCQIITPSLSQDYKHMKQFDNNISCILKNSNN